jgi:hypothetical protein
MTWFLKADRDVLNVADGVSTDCQQPLQVSCRISSLPEFRLCAFASLEIKLMCQFEWLLKRYIINSLVFNMLFVN